MCDVCKVLLLLLLFIGNCEWNRNSAHFLSRFCDDVQCVYFRFLIKGSQFICTSLLHYFFFFVFCFFWIHSTGEAGDDLVYCSVYYSAINRMHANILWGFKRSFTHSLSLFIVSLKIKTLDSSRFSVALMFL